MAVRASYDRGAGMAGSVPGSRENLAQAQTTDHDASYSLHRGGEATFNRCLFGLFKNFLFPSMWPC